MRLRMLTFAIALVATIAGTVPASSTLAKQSAIQRRAVFPNPFTTLCHFELSMPSAGRVKVIVYDYLGRQIVQLRDEEYGAGNYLIEWNGRDESGREAPPGIYIAVLWQDGRAISSAKVVKISGELR